MLQDFRLGVRMLLKFPGLTIAGGLALAFAIGVGAAWYEIMGDLLAPTMPVPDGKRVVLVETHNALTNVPERRVLHDFIAWRRELRSVERLGAFRTSVRNFLPPDGPPEPVTVAELTPEALQLADVPPLAGRRLVESDGIPGSPRVAVISHDLWQRALGARAGVVGTVVRLGGESVEVVGVMPEGFAYPINHQIWTALQLPPSGYAPLDGPDIEVIGRLARDVSRAEASAEIALLGEKLAITLPGTHQHLRSRITGPGAVPDSLVVQMALKSLPMLLVLAIACINVGTLVYARTAVREGEIAVRFALGASRSRIVMQLFVEALALTLLAGAVGLVAADWTLRRGIEAQFSGGVGGAPFWVTPGLTPMTVVAAAVLAVIAASILGLVPALKVTRARGQSGLASVGDRGSTLRFGGVWTAAMVIQVALTVLAFPVARGIAEEALRDRRVRTAFPATEYLAARIALDETLTADGNPVFASRIARSYAALEQRIAREPGVVAVTFGDRMPGMEPSVRSAEVALGSARPSIAIGSLWTAEVGPGYFEAFDRPIVAGRGFHPGDEEADARTVIVNEAFARLIARRSAGAPVVGARLRASASATSADEPWLEIVGIVRDIGMTPTDLGEAPYVYRAASPSTVVPLIVGVRVRGQASTLVARMGTIAAAVDPGLRVDEVQPLDEWAWRADLHAVVAAAGLAGAVSLALFLSASGIFALMSVDVTRRTREIGLRAALGASPRDLVVGIFSRVFLIVGGSVAAGSALMVIGVWALAPLGVAYFARWLIVASAVMLAAGLLACIQPARRVLSVTPIEALRQG